MVPYRPKGNQLEVILTNAPHPHRLDQPVERPGDQEHRQPRADAEEQRGPYRAHHPEEKHLSPADEIAQNPVEDFPDGVEENAHGGNQPDHLPCRYPARQIRRAATAQRPRS